MRTAGANLTKRITAIEKKINHLVHIVEDLTLTPSQYAKLMEVGGAIGSGKYRKWKTIDEIREES